MAWQEIEKARYDAAYATGKYVPVNEIRFYHFWLPGINFSKINTILDIGCGLGWGVQYFRKIGKIAHGIDISNRIVWSWKERKIDKFCEVASADSIPFPDDSFDLVMCLDVLEHIPCYAMQDVLREIRRVGNHDFVFLICCEPAHDKMPHDGSEPHICIHDYEWWREQMIEAEYINAPLDIREDHVMIYCIKELIDKQKRTSAGDSLLLYKKDELAENRKS